MSEEKLKLCPFHETPSMMEAYQCDISKRWKVGCGACGSHSGSCKTREEAVRLWNTRAEIPKAWWDRLRIRLTCNAEANHSALGDYGRGWGDGFKAALEEVDRIERGE